MSLEGENFPYIRFFKVSPPLEKSFFGLPLSLLLPKSRILNFTITYTGLVMALHGKPKIVYNPEGEEGSTQEVDFTPPFRRVHIIKDLEKLLKVKFPDPTTFDTEGLFIHSIVSEERILRSNETNKLFICRCSQVF